uniref:ABC transporter ATP-binding protein n=1 Tax=Agathobacter sp. TaxID=2021311 RepID=UPI0040565602
MIKLCNVCAGYGEKEVLHNICISFKPQKIYVLVGANGCGKSTLLKTLIRINPHTKGEIFVSSKRIKEYKPNELAKKIAYLPQGKKVPDISVLRMVLHGRFAYLDYPRKYRKKDYEIARSALEWAGLSRLEDENVSHLSGGMQQNVYIAMALAQDADTVLMDEPTTYLDIIHQLRLMEMARRLAKQGKCVVMVLHDLSQALQVADEVIVMKEGKILDAGTPEEIYQTGRIEEAFGVQLERVETANSSYFIPKMQQNEESTIFEGQQVNNA